MSHTCRNVEHQCLADLELTPIVCATDLSSFTEIADSSFDYLWPTAFQAGQQLRLRAPDISPDISVDTLVTHCCAVDNGFMLTLAGLDQEQAYRFRMLLQLSHIHHYHQKLQDQGTPLSLNEAAGEWISRFAESFPLAPAF